MALGKETTNQTRVIGRLIERRGQVASTNTLVRERARAGEPEGLVIVADEQTAGRGRLGRGWSAPPGSSLLMSALLRPTFLSPDAAFLITMLAAVSLCEAVEVVAPPLAARLKWPNDLLLPASPAPEAPLRKAAGILSELALHGDRIAFVALGIGVNVSWSPSGIVDGRDLSSTATSVQAARGTPLDREALLAAMLERLDAGYQALRRGQREALFAAWQARLGTLGQRVSVTTPTGTRSGLAESVDPSGSLCLRDASGQLHVITAGDVSA